MKNFVRFLSYVLVAVLSATLAFGWAYDNQPEYSKLQELEDLIGERFIGHADETAMEDAAAAAMLEATGDRWSYYIPASEYASHLEAVQNAYVGIGITIAVAEDGSGLDVLEVNPDGPAMEAGIRVGDVVIAVEGQPTAGQTTEETRNLVRGKEGTTVSITVRRGTEEITMDVMRRQILTPVATWEMLPGNVGYITIANFDERCADESITAIEELRAQGAESILFDVRNNPGGYASELVKLLDYLLPEGDLFRAVDYTGKESVDRSDAAFLDMPMAVLVNRDSYSAAEFFAVALQEYEAAIVIGEQTSGKGYFQNNIRLKDGSAVALSVGKYYTPKGISLEGVGITPDVLLTLDDETDAKLYYGQLTMEEDPHIQAALEALK